jgi:CheY-like chemotaxis protein
LAESDEKERKLQAIGAINRSVARKIMTNAQDVIAECLGAQDIIGGDSSLAKSLQTIGELAKRNLLLADQLKQINKVTATSANKVSINELLTNILDAFSEREGESVQISKVLTPEIWDAYINQEHLKLAVENILQNAVEAMSSNKGTLHIATCNLEIDSQFAGLYSGLQPGRYVYLSIEDSGIGMDSHIEENAVVPFFSSKADQDGLGLTFADELLKTSGGQLNIYSEPGLGTTIKLFIPAYLSQKTKNDTESAPILEDVSVTNGREKTILVVDDEIIVLRVTAEILKSLGYNVLSAMDGKKAIEVARKCNHTIDLIIMDLSMPEMSGDEAYPQLKEMLPSTKILICSGFAKDERVQQLLEKGAVGFIQKPFRAQELVEALSNYLTV